LAFLSIVLQHVDRGCTNRYVERNIYKGEDLIWCNMSSKGLGDSGCCSHARGEDIDGEKGNN
jgi:hypothetical protein